MQREYTVADQIASDIDGPEQELRQFLAAFQGPFTLALLGPDGSSMKCKTYLLPEKTDAVVSTCVKSRGRGLNVYFTLNAPKPELVGTQKNPSKADIGMIRGISVDIDPDAAEEAKPGGFDRERDRLRAIADEWRGREDGPTFIVDSGNGKQMHWVLSEPMENTPENQRRVEAQAAGLADPLGGDATHSVQHFYRMPGTRNFPNAAKRAKGRVESPAKLLFIDNAKRHSLDDLAKIAPPKIGGSAGSLPQIDMDYSAVLDAAESGPESLPESLQQRSARICASPAFKTAIENPDRSDCDYALASQAVRDGMTDPTEIGCFVFAHSSGKLSEKEAQGYGESYARNTVAKAIENVSLSQFFQPSETPASTDELRVAYSIEIDTGLTDISSIQVREYVINPRLPLGHVHQLSGEPGGSKSSLALRDALMVCTEGLGIRSEIDQFGNPLHREELHRGGPVLIYNAEDTQNEMKRRLAAAEKAYGITAADKKHPIIRVSGMDGPALKLLAPEKGRRSNVLERAPGADVLERLLSEHKPVLVYLDTQLSLVSGADENSNDHQDALFQLLGQIANRHNTCIAVIHHTAKATRDNAGDMGAGRGGFAAIGKARSGYTLCTVTGKREDEKALGLTAEDDLIRLDASKASYSPGGVKPIFFKRRSVPVGNGSAGSASGARQFGEFFGLSPRQRLEIDGDLAAVLEVYDIQKHKAAAQVERGEQERKAAEDVARIVLSEVGGPGQFQLSKYQVHIAERMRDLGLHKLGVNNTADVRKCILKHIGHSVVIDDERVEVWVEKSGSGSTAPYLVHVKSTHTAEEAE